MINELTSTSYNPCSNGILINEFLQFRRLTFFRLNPCSNGILINIAEELLDKEQTS